MGSTPKPRRDVVVCGQNSIRIARELEETGATTAESANGIHEHDALTAIRCVVRDLIQRPAIMAAAKTPIAPARRRRRRIRFRRRALAALLLLLPSAWTVAADLARRAAFLFHFNDTRTVFYLSSLAATLGFWTVLMVVASRRKRVVGWIFAALFVLLFVLETGVQGAFFGIFRTYHSLEADIYTRSWFWPIVGSLPLAKPIVWLNFGLALVLASGSVVFARRYVRPTRLLWRISVPIALGALVALRFIKSSYHPVQASTPDVLYFHAIVGNVEEHLGITDSAPRTRPQKRHSKSVPKIANRPSKPRNVLLVLQESQRFDVTCTEYDPECPLATRASNKAMPNRMPFLRWHSVASSTNLSCMTLWSGLLPSDPKVDLETAPTMFGFAKALGYETVYWTSQHVIFQNMRMQMQDEPIDRFAVATTLNLKANWDTGAKDALLSDYAIEHWDEIPEPFFAIVHYSNQHSPYVIDETKSPFPRDDSQDDDAFDNRIAKIKNVTYLSDLAVGRLLEKVKSSRSGKNTVVVYTSDHSEGQGDHGWSGHTVSFYESEIHVPTWIDAPPGVLTDEERGHLVERKQAWLTHADMTPTFLDLMGAWDAPELAPFRAKMVGRPLTRVLEPYVAIPMTNNSWIWESSDRNWGYIRGGLKLFGTDNAKRYRCYDLEQDPGELKDLGESRCGDLGQLTRALFPPLITPKRPYHPLR